MSKKNRNFVTFILKLSYTPSLFYKKRVKKLVSVAVMITVVLLSEAMFAQRNEPFVISGVWERKETPKEVVLFQVVSGRLEAVSVTLLQNDKSFAMAYAPPREGFYVVGIGNPSIRADKYTFYFKPGDQLNFIVNDTSYTLVGKNTPENVAMTAWHSFILPLERMSFYPSHADYREFFAVMESQSQKPFRPTPTGNRVFDRAFANYRELDLTHVAINFVQTPFIDLPENDDFPRFFKGLNVKKFDNTSSLIFPYRLLTNILLTQDLLSKNPVSGNNPNLALMSILTNDTLKGEVFLYILATVEDVLEMRDLSVKFSQYIITEDQKRRFNLQIERIHRLHLEKGPGVTGFIPSYEDVHGNLISAAEFKGKVMYVYIWATWCAPCLAQIPDKKRLKELYDGSDDLVIIGVSIDAQKDLQKWRDFVKERDLGGIQVHGNIEGPYNISKLYHVTGIPRFLLFDKEGKIVSTDAPRPSSPELIPLLNKLLKQ
jgi:thiol-disulfide isomerase/thioredoxin